QVGLAGGVIVGDGAVLGGRVGVADHLKIGARAVVGAAACVGTNVPAGAVYAGYPAVPRAEAMTRRTVRDTLASYGSHCSAASEEQSPMSDELSLAARYALQPVDGPCLVP